MLTAIFANGAQADPPYLTTLLVTATLTVTANSGSSACERLGILPMYSGIVSICSFP
jgi:hypothetical protein